LPVRLFAGRSREVIAAADVVLTASGTATLEALLSKRPMVVAYRVHPLSYQVVKRLGLVKVPYVAMANILVGRALAPEFIQDRCRPELMAPAVLSALRSPQRVQEIQAEYTRIHRALRRDSAVAAASEVLQLLEAEGAAAGHRGAR
jgi:lipid-A-disaccharide synthase